MENRRQFTRILFSIKALLAIDKKQYPVTIHDISLNGALVSTPKTSDNIKSKIGSLEFMLDENAPEIVMHVAVVHQENDETGLQCNAIDIDSITQLKRLIELNLGDQGQLDKELSQLSREIA